MLDDIKDQIAMLQMHVNLERIDAKFIRIHAATLIQLADLALERAEEFDDEVRLARNEPAKKA